LRDAACKSLGNDVVHEAEWKRVEEQDIRDAPLERILDIFHEVYGDEGLSYLSVLGSTVTNRNHDSLAIMAKHSYVTTIVTLNFDRLFEQSLSNRNVSWRLINTLVDDRFDDSSTAAVQIVKPHGSLPEAGNLEEMAESLGATLKQVGSGPDRRNQECIASVLRKHPVLLVTGYRDSDWDIFPILVRLSNLLSRVYWVQHNPAEELPQHVVEWLETKTHATVLQGNVANLLSDVCEILAGEVPVVDDRDTWSAPHASECFPSDSKNALGLAMLMEGGRPKSLRRRLLRVLQHDAEIQSDPNLKSLRLRCIASILHTSRRVHRALIANRAAYVVQRPQSSWGSPALAARRIWIGYEWLCLAKRPRRSLWRTFPSLVGYVVRGLVLLFISSLVQQKGRTSSECRLRRKNRTLALYYVVDLFHTWASVLLLKGRSVVSRHAYLFRLLHGGYSLAGRFGGGLMEWEYYWLRDLETMILGGLDADDKAIEQGLRELEMAYALTQNTVQMGNVYCYLALLEFSRKNVVSGQIVEWLDAAHAYWSTPEHWTPSGLYRVILFRRFMNVITEEQARTMLLQYS